MIPRGIGLLGGTFDPVHNGHLELARAALGAFGLVRVDFLPAGAPWQKQWVTSGEHRLAMLELALDKMPDFGIETDELMRSEPTYTIDTLERLRRRVGPAMPLVLLIGGDQWRNLHTWRRWRELTDFASIGVCRRGDAPLEAAPEVVDWSRERLRPAETLNEVASGGIAFFGMQPHEASATAVRRAVGAQPFAVAMRRLDGWLPLAVAGYIRARGLYGARG